MKRITSSRALAFLLLLLPLSAKVNAQVKKEDKIDVTYRNCLLKDTSSGNIDGCAFIAYGSWNKEMDNAYDKLLKVLKKEKDKDALKQAQTAWKAYRDAEFTSYDNMFNQQGSQFCLMRQNGRIDLVKTRAVQLKNYAEGLKYHPPKHRPARAKKIKKA